jgi:hypothetical protein
MLTHVTAERVPHACIFRRFIEEMRLPVDGGAEDVVRLKKPCEWQEDSHCAGRPVEDLQREGCGERRVWQRLGFAEDQTANDRDPGREGEEQG